MKYACLFKSLDELNVSDFDDEVLEEYGTLSILEVSEDGKDAMVSYKKPNYEKVISTIGELKKEWREKQMELVLGDLSDRIADKVIEKLEEVR